MNMKPSYSIVRTGEQSSSWTFTRCYDTFLEAKEEAERLARKERCAFVVLKSVAKVKPLENPLEWQMVDSCADAVCACDLEKLV